ncbi:MAG: ribbon-helix-helix protein, CopG family [Chthoniobacteraceae bacterium]
MPVLTVRISEEEKALLTERSKKEGISAGALVRQMLNQTPFVTAADVLKDMERRLGDKRLRVRRKK